MFLKNERIRWIAVFVAIALLFVGVTVSLCLSINSKASSGKPDEVALNEEEKLELVTVEECGVQLLASGGSSDYAFRRTLTATVRPFDAPNKEVDWSVAWESGASRASENVREYMTVTPNSDGSNVAVVNCLKAFEGDKILITVTTRVGGYHATCEAQYKGIPQRMTIDTSGKTVRTDSAWNLSMIELESGDTYRFNLTLDNDLHVVGSTYGQYVITLTPHGSIDVDIEHYRPQTGESEFSEGTVDLEVTDSFEEDGYVMAFLRGSPHLVLAKVSISNGQLVVEAPNAAASYQVVTGGSQVGMFKRTFKGYTDGKMPYVTITVTEMNSRLSKTINVKTTSVVTGVNVSSDELIF